ncbi:MAG TPA: type II toxin-antitoxin system HicA family toxin [Terriglobia bacterium]|jgi:mRNA interferase HicA|nr:type II toxin-antitoxin system HicA family toxin [Terriglobia bacterium]
MKRRELIRKLEELGCTLVRHGASHDWYTNPTAKQSQPVPRHTEIHEGLARSIIKKLSRK